MKVKAMVVGGTVLVCGALGLAIASLAADVTVSIDETPAAVKAAIEKEVEGGKIIKIEKDEYDGKTVYEVEYMDDGKVEEAAFTEDGKSVGEDDDAKGDDNKKDVENDGEDKD